MSLALFGLVLLVACVALGWKHHRTTAGVVAGVLLGVVIAGSDGALADTAHALVGGIRSNLNALGAWILS
jgi:hypothetical protein